MKKLHPSVEALIKPIVHEMTKIDLAQRTNPIIGSHNEPEPVKRAKRRCVHITFDGAEYHIRAIKNGEGKLVCEVCDHEIADKFDKTTVDKIIDVIPVINQLVLFGMLNGLSAEPLNTLISLKTILPDVAQLAAHLNDYVKRDNNNRDSEKNIGMEYSNNLRSITSM